MKTVGLLGGMSWESTVGYYQQINQGVNAALRGLHSAKIVMYSVDFAEIEALQRLGEWKKTAIVLANSAKILEFAGADCILICTNTMHKVASDVASSVNIPLLHIADATGGVLVSAGISKVGLLGTGFTMEQDFYKDRLSKGYDLEVLVPSKTDRDIVHDVIYKELCLGQINENSKKEYIRIIDKLAAEGAEAIILGCTEIGLLIKQSDTPIKLFDTVSIHAEQAVKFALGSSF